MRLVILDAGLTGRTGRRANADRLMVAEARARGIECMVYGNQGIGADPHGDLPAEPHFRCEPAYRFSQDPLSGPIENYVLGNQVYLEDLKRLDPGRFAPNDVLVFQPVNQNQLQAIGAWAQGLPAANLPRIVIGLWFEPNHEAATMTDDMAHALYRLAFKAFSDPSAKRVRFSCMTKAQADVYNFVAGRPLCHPTATPHTDSGAPLVERPSTGEAPCLAFLGRAEKIRGFELIPGIIENLVGSHPDLRAVVQITGAGAEPAQLNRTVTALAGLSAARPQIRLLQGDLAEADYAAALQASDIVVLPYRSKFYPCRATGIFMDAMNLGKPLVLPTGTWMGRKASAWDVGTVFDSFSSASVAAAIRAVLDDLPAYQARAVAGAKRWRETQGAGLFFDFILHDRDEASSADRQVRH